MTEAERQARCRERKYAALPGDPMLDGIPTDCFGDLPTIEDIEAAVAHDPGLQAEVRMEYAAAVAELGEDEP